MRSGTWSRTAVGLLVGGILLALVTALLTAAVFSFSAASKANDLSRKFLEANQQLEQLQDDNKDAQARSVQAQHDRADLMAQNELLQRQVSALVRFLRAHGIAVPTVPSAAPSATRSKPAPSQRAKQSSPNGPGPCRMGPLLCPFPSFPFSKAAIHEQVNLPRPARHSVSRGEQHPRHPVRGKARVPRHRH